MHQPTQDLKLKAKAYADAVSRLSDDGKISASHRLDLATCGRALNGAHNSFMSQTPVIAASDAEAAELAAVNKHRATVGLEPATTLRARSNA